jgi:hypothetical protein
LTDVIARKLFVEAKGLENGNSSGEREKVGRRKRRGSQGERARL